MTASPDADLPNGFFGVKARVLAVGFRRHPQFLAVFGCERAQGVLNTVAKLAQNVLGHICGILGDEIDADPLWSGSDVPLVQPC